MSLETGLNFQLLHKNAAVSKRHCKRYFYLKFLVRKESMCHVMQNGWYCIIINLIRYWDKMGSEGFHKICLVIYDNKVALRLYLILYSWKKIQLTEKRNYGFLQRVLYFT